MSPQSAPGKAVFNKLNSVVQKNVGLTILKNISNVLSGNNINTEFEHGLPEDFLTDDLVYFKFAPITSADIERSFSMYKTLLSNNRRSFHFENLYKHLIIQCNFQGKYMIKCIIIIFYYLIYICIFFLTEQSQNKRVPQSTSCP